MAAQPAGRTRDELDETFEILDRDGAVVVFGGDLNGEDVSVVDSARYAGVNAEAAYNTFGQTALDHIFYSAQGTLLSANTAGDLTLSDHLALQAAIEFSV